MAAGPTFDTASAAASLWRFGWIAWWSQFVLTTIAAVILVFSFAFPGVIVATSASKLGTLLAAVGVATGLVSNVWTYGYTRLSLSLGRAGADAAAAKAKSAAATAAGIRNRLRVGVGLALAGLGVSLLGVQAIVGTLLARLLSSGLGEAYGTAGGIGRVPGGVQPVDILVVQAAANGMLGLLCALVVSLWLGTRVNKWAERGGGAPARAVPFFFGSPLWGGWSCLGLLGGVLLAVYSVYDGFGLRFSLAWRIFSVCTVGHGRVVGPRGGVPLHPR